MGDFVGQALDRLPRSILAPVVIHDDPLTPTARITQSLLNDIRLVLDQTDAEYIQVILQPLRIDFPKRDLANQPKDVYFFPQDKNIDRF